MLWLVAISSYLIFFVLLVTLSSLLFFTRKYPLTDPTIRPSTHLFLQEACTYTRMTPSHHITSPSHHISHGYRRQRQSINEVNRSISPSRRSINSHWLSVVRPYSGHAIGKGLLTVFCVRVHEYHRWGWSNYLHY